MNDPIISAVIHANRVGVDVRRYESRTSDSVGDIVVR